MGSDDTTFTPEEQAELAAFALGWNTETYILGNPDADLTLIGSVPLSLLDSFAQGAAAAFDAADDVIDDSEVR